MKTENNTMSWFATYRLPTLLLALAFCTYGCGAKNPAPASLQNLGNGICRDTSSGLMWQREASNMIPTSAEAEGYVKTLDLGGYHDWRLPTSQELYGLTTLFDLHHNGDCNFPYQGYFWSSEGSGVSGMVGAWEFSANQCDAVREYVHGRQGRVRAVRP